MTDAEKNALECVAYIAKFCQEETCNKDCVLWNFCDTEVETRHWDKLAKNIKDHYYD